MRIRSRFAAFSARIASADGGSAGAPFVEFAEEGLGLGPAPGVMGALADPPVMTTLLGLVGLASGGGAPAEEEGVRGEAAPSTEEERVSSAGGAAAGAGGEAAAASVSAAAAAGAGAVGEVTDAMAGGGRAG